MVYTPICYLVDRECIFDDVTANNSNEYVTIKVDRRIVSVYTWAQVPLHESYITPPLQNKIAQGASFQGLDLHGWCFLLQAGRF